MLVLFHLLKFCLEAHILVLEHVKLYFEVYMHILEVLFLKRGLCTSLRLAILALEELGKLGASDQVPTSRL